MPKAPPKILLFNPWIYDFAAYDFWTKPLGLLRVGTFLQQAGCEIHLVDCLDRHHPVLLKYLGSAEAKTRADGSGKYHREEIRKPAVLGHIPRKYCRYGMPPEVVSRLLDQVPFVPDVIFVTSIMTYWYPAVRDAVMMLRTRFPKVPVVLGGIYATLCPQHAKRVSGADVVIQGPGESQALRLVAQMTGFPLREPDENEPFANYDLYPRLVSVAVMTSRGCPYRCSFCASHLVSPEYERRAVDRVLAELARWVDRNVEHVAFFDDALLHRSAQSFKPLLEGIVKRRWSLQLHMPNGLPPRQIDAETAELLRRAGARTVRLSFETSNVERQRTMSSKVTNEDLERALSHLESAGFQRHHIGVYVLMGLPDQGIDEVRESVRYVTDLGAKVNLASFSPIPGTVEWQRAVKAGAWNESADLLLTNNSVFPIWAQKYGYDACTDLVQWVKGMNQTLESVM